MIIPLNNHIFFNCKLLQRLDFFHSNLLFYSFVAFLQYINDNPLFVHPFFSPIYFIIYLNWMFDIIPIGHLLGTTIMPHMYWFIYKILSHWTHLFHQLNTFLFIQKLLCCFCLCSYINMFPIYCQHIFRIFLIFFCYLFIINIIF